MSVVQRLIGEVNLTYRGVPPRSDSCCYERELMPRWRSPEAMGDDAQAMGYVCHRCGREYLPARVSGRRLIGSPLP